MGSFFEKIIEREVNSINDHLPQERIPLSELIKEDRPSYRTKDGQTSVFKKSEIEFLSKEVPQQYHAEIELPIIILRRLDLGRGVHTVAGGKPVLFLIHRVLGDVDLGWSDLYGTKLENSFARPQVQIIRRKLPTTTCLGFVHLGMQKG